MWSIAVKIFEFLCKLSEGLGALGGMGYAIPTIILVLGVISTMSVLNYRKKLDIEPALFGSVVLSIIACMWPLLLLLSMWALAASPILAALWFVPRGVAALVSRAACRWDCRQIRKELDRVEQAYDPVLAEAQKEVDSLLSN